MTGSEKFRTPEDQPFFRVGDEVLVPYPESQRPSVVIQEINDAFVLTSQILSDEKGIRLAQPGTSPVKSLEHTGNTWDTQQIVNGLYGAFDGHFSHEQIREQFRL